MLTFKGILFELIARRCLNISAFVFAVISNIGSRPKDLLEVKTCEPSKPSDHIHDAMPSNALFTVSCLFSFSVIFNLDVKWQMMNFPVIY